MKKESRMKSHFWLACQGGWWQWHRGWWSTVGWMDRLKLQMDQLAIYCSKGRVFGEHVGSGSCVNESKVQERFTALRYSSQFTFPWQLEANNGGKNNDLDLWLACWQTSFTCLQVSGIIVRNAALSWMGHRAVSVTFSLACICCRAFILSGDRLLNDAKHDKHQQLSDPVNHVSY